MSTVKGGAAETPAPAARRSRRYHAPRRAARAEERRQRILSAARRLFVDQGLLPTTITDIAKSAHSSPQRIYATFGSKTGLLLAILDELTNIAGLARLPGQLAAASGDPYRQLELYLEFDARLFVEGRDIIGVGLASRGADPEIGAWFAEGERRRRANQFPLVRAWHRAGDLRAGLGERRAADILWAFSGPAVYDLFVTQSGWPPGTFERWLAHVLRRELFGG